MKPFPRHPFLLALIAAGLVGAGAQAQPVANDGHTVSRPLEILRQTQGAELLGAKIVGGVPARAGDDPWQVALVDGLVAGQRRGFCGGTILAARWIVTAAHCVDRGTRPADVDVIAGTTNLPAGGQRLKVSEIIVHGAWNPASRNDDVALLRLAADAPAGALPLISRAQDAAIGAAPLRVTGWGAIVEGGAMQPNLRSLEVHLIDTGLCNKGVSYGGAITNHMMCAGFLAPGRDSCQGDSGGPLSLPVSGGRVLAGIVSWGKGCAEKDKPGVYTRVAAVRPWIRACMDGLPICTRQ